MFDPPTLTGKGSTFTVNVMVSGGQNVYSVPVQLSYDPEPAAGAQCFERRIPVAGRADRALGIATIQPPARCR